MKTKKNVLIMVTILVVFIVAVAVGIKIFHPYKHKEYISKYSAQYGLDPYFVAAVINVESGFNSKAKSSKGARGLMQITDETAKWAAEKMGISDFNPEDLYDPETNIAIGCWYIDNLNQEFDNETDLVLAAYNGGRGNVQKWLKDEKHSSDGKSLQYIPFKETDKYIKKVKVNFKIYNMLYGK